MTVRAVLFDLGNTLLEYKLQGQWRQFLHQRLVEIHPIVAETMQLTKTAPDEFAARVAAVIGGERARAVERSGRSWHFADRLAQGLASVGLRADPALLDRLIEAFYEPIRASTRPYPDTRTVLDQLRARGIPLAIITNSPWDTPARLLRGDLQQWDCDGFFDAFVCSGEVPWRKPNPAFMLAAAEALAAAPDECLVVGDSLESDIAGARAAEMRSVWINPAGAAAPADGPQPDGTARTLTDVVTWVEEERPRRQKV